MSDRIEEIGKSLIQHGKYNDRIYLIKFDPADTEELLEQFDALASEHGYSKVFAKIAHEAEEAFLTRGFVREAVIPSYYNGNDCLFMAKYHSEDRGKCSHENRGVIDDVLERAREKAGKKGSIILPEECEFAVLEERHLEDLASLYRAVFPSYPFPIYDPEYLRETMRSHVVYFGCFVDGKLVAASSSEMDPKSRSAEMTDFATLPAFRGKNLSLYLLEQMELEMKRRGIRTAYTIARSVSHGMNITFSKSGYAYGGTLVNNTNISGNIESMNVWYKQL